MITVEGRLWSRIDKRGPDECWPWQEKSRNEHGYGILHVGKMGQVRKAHRVVYEVTHGVTLAPDVKVRHTCDNPPCCNPRHLIAGSQAENVADMHARGRRQYASKFDTDAIRAAVGTHAEIAVRFGCSQSYVSMIKSGARRGR